MTSRLKADFFSRCSVVVAKELLGKKFVFNGIEGIITETEGYKGLDDEASHAFKGPTKRAAIMFGPPGRVYVYMIYGMYFCLNFIAHMPQEAGGVLIRGIKTSDTYLNGPGKICRYFNINKEHNGVDLLTHPDIYLIDGFNIERYLVSPRIGITKAIDRLWRFYIDIINI